MTTAPILRQKIVLNVNTRWEPIGYKMVRKALVDMTGGKSGNTPPAHAFIIEYEKDDNGIYDFSKPSIMRPVPFDEWLEQPIRGHDAVVHTPHRQIRVPTVIMSVNMDKNPAIKKKHPTKRDILVRDNFTCQYTGKRYSAKELTIDHVISRAEWKRRGLPGTPDTWENLVASYGPINLEKGDKPLSETGLKLIRKPIAPPEMCLTQLIREIRHRDWLLFFDKKGEGREVKFYEDILTA